MNFQALAQQNPWWADRSRLSGDQTLLDYAAQTVRWTPRLLDRFLFSRDRVYTLRGPRQVGKTTLLKLLLARLVREESVDPRAIFYFSCDLLRGPRDLSDLVDTYLKWQEPLGLKRRYILLAFEIASPITRRFSQHRPRPPKHSPCEVALPFGQGGIASAPGDYKGGRSSPLSDSWARSDHQHRWRSPALCAGRVTKPGRGS